MPGNFIRIMPMLKIMRKIGIMTMLKMMLKIGVMMMLKMMSLRKMMTSRVLMIRMTHYH